jgi:D-alanyl-lipoteichoic acid acyltransferase DltB (MBOAT superfamily)
MIRVMHNAGKTVAFFGMVACLFTGLWGWAAAAFLMFILLVIVGITTGIEK